jgi:hypothetical protein
MATITNRVFFPQQVLDQWLSGGEVDLRGTELTIMDEQRRYAIAEAFYIVREVSGSPDPNNLVGRVKPKELLEKNGAELFDTSILLGENAYDVVPGWLGAPIGTFEEHLANPSRRPSGGEFGEEPKTDEDLLARFVLKSLK